MSLDLFCPAVRRWFAGRFGEPTPAQRQGWPRIREGGNVLIAAPTGTGKTLAAFLWALDCLLRAPPPPSTTILYLSPLKALANDVEKNLLGPLEEMHALDPALPELSVMVRSGDTPARERARMTRTPPHILVTTPESFYILLTSDGGRRMLRGVKTVIVDEIHALARDKRGSHLSLSLERLEALSGPFQRIGLSATQRPLEAMGSFLSGAGRATAIVDAGHLRALDLAVEVPPSPLRQVCSHEQWEEIYVRLGALIEEHTSTLLFVNTRRMAERLAARLQERLPAGLVACHHGSLSKERRLEAERHLKEGRLKALVATASLELGIDIGDVDLAVQIGAARSIATFLQRMGRAGHGVGRVPKGRIFPLTLDELAEAAALLRAVREGLLDSTPHPRAPLDILAQQIVAECVPESWEESRLFEAFRRAWPYRELTREEFDSVVALHAQGRYALLHRDGVQGKLRATRRARLPVLVSGGAIPDTGDYQVLLEPEGTRVGSLNEDFAIESQRGDIVQLGTHSWRILRIEPGIVRVADAKGAPPTLPFWLGEAPSRTPELSSLIAAMREEIAEGRGLEGLPEAAADSLREYVAEGRRVLGAVPTQRRLVLERFFDEGGGMQLVVHSPFGGRINRAFGLALRKRFCRSFGFELQAAANEEAIVLSLGPQHNFPLAEVFDYLRSATAKEVLVQALLAQPMFETRWRWNATRALLVERTRQGKPIPLLFQRMRAQDLLARAFPEAVACGETLPPGDLPVPMEQPLVRQTVLDCLHEAMDLDGLLDLLRDLEEGSIERVAVDTAEPSTFARGILSAQPYAFLDDAPLEERRTHAVLQRRTLAPELLDTVGALAPEAVRRVREEAWPAPRDAEEAHEALGWIGYVTEEEAAPWRAWLEELRAQGRVTLEGGRWLAAESTRDPLAMLRGRMEALGPVVSDDPLLAALEREGCVLRVRIEGREAWCDRRLLARIQRATLEGLRREIQPVSAADFLRFLLHWQHAAEGSRLMGPAGVAAVLRQLAGFEAPATAWEGAILPARVQGYRREWLDAATLSGEFVWGRLWGSGACAVRSAPLCFWPREDSEHWLGLADAPQEAPGGTARQVQELLAARGAVFLQEIGRGAGILPAQVEAGLQELVARGLATSDSVGALRMLLAPPSRRRHPLLTAGRWSLLRRDPFPAPTPEIAEFVARRLMERTGVVFRKTLLRERQPLPFGKLLRALRTLELRGEVRGGRFVAGFDCEQYALPEAVPLLRAIRRGERPGPPALVSPADPLNYLGILTPEERVPPRAKGRVAVG
ncbi:MAG: DEAD/DEAH box helicase [Planctomycetaceae bacterium]